MYTHRKVDIMYTWYRNLNQYYSVFIINFAITPYYLEMWKLNTLNEYKMWIWNLHRTRWALSGEHAHTSIAYLEHVHHHFTSFLWLTQKCFRYTFQSHNCLVHLLYSNLGLTLTWFTVILCKCMYVPLPATVQVGTTPATQEEGMFCCLSVLVCLFKFYMWNQSVDHLELLTHGTYT